MNLFIFICIFYCICIFIVIQPGYPKMPLTSGQMIDEWLNFYNMSAPLTCVGYLMSHDPVTVYWCIFCSLTFAYRNELPVAFSFWWKSKVHPRQQGSGGDVLHCCISQHHLTGMDGCWFSVNSRFEYSAGNERPVGSRYLTDWLFTITKYSLLKYNHGYWKLLV